MTITGVQFATEVLNYLDLHHIITLSTSSFTGLPHANTVAYASDEQSIFFGASPDAVVARNIRDNKYVSFTIDDYTADWRKVRELVGIGSSAPTTDAEAELARGLFAEKYGGTGMQAGGTIYVIHPGEVHFVDYDYSMVAGEEATAEVTSRVYQLGGVNAEAQSGAVSTELDQRSFPAGTIIFRPGDPVGQFWVVASGRVEVRNEGFGADQTVTRLGPGQLFGDRAALRGKPGALTVHAVEDTVLLAVRPDSVRDLFIARGIEKDSDPPIAT